jgi:two-component system alkaline phosphatase synthesis response regulator PhoP
MSEEKKIRILLVDDEPDIVSMVKMRLEANNYEVMVANDGNTAYSMARSDFPDLIILDLMLPGMDGYKVCGLLKKDSRYSKIPIILFTARAQETDKKMGEEVGADSYLNKTCEPKELLENIKFLLAKRNG